MSRSEFAAFVAGHRSYRESLRQSGHGLASEGGGFFLIDARDLDEAIRVASKIPAARLGSVEIRPIRESDPR